MNPLLKFFATGADRPVLADKEEIDRLYHRHRLAVMTTITLGYGIAYTCRLGLSVVKKPLIDGGIFTADQLGTIGSAFLYTYAFGKLTNGFLADHANVRTFFSTGLLISALLNVVLGAGVETLWLWVVLWGLNGWFQGFGAPAGMVALSQWYGNRERGRFYGIWSTAHSLGEGLTFVGSAALVTWFGWRAGFLGPGLLCVVLAGVMFVFLQDRPQTLGLPAVADWRGERTALATDVRPKTTWEAQLSILKMPSIWVLALASATMYMTRYGMNSWGMLYLQEEKGYSDLAAGGLLALNPVAGIAGCVAYGFISDKFFGARRPPVNLLCGVLELVALALMFFSPPGHPLLLAIAFLLYGFSINGLVTSLGGLFAVDLAPKKAAGAAMGVIGVFSYLGAAAQERISGALIQQGTTLAEGVRHYDFQRVIYFWLGSSVISLLLAASLWRARTRE